MVGNVRALDNAKITKEADFQGEIKAKRISVEDGAYLEADIEMERES
jgi:cytoskeletal protein CcmA (bactofilin family)